jgi:hypothetical protein
MNNQVVARYVDGRMVKGVTNDFSPTKLSFRLQHPDRKVQEIQVRDLKAVFFVRSLQGNRTHREKKGFEGAKGFGRKVSCTFRDGEVLTGFTTGYDPIRQGFFVIPSDPESNNERIFVVTGATRSVVLL